MPTDRRDLLAAEVDGARRRALAALADGAGPADARCDLAFAAILACDFAEAGEQARLARDLAPDCPTVRATLALVAGMVGAAEPDPVPGGGTWVACLLAEAAMARGRLDTAERTAAAALADGADGGYRVFLGQTLARALLYQGRITEAAEVVARALAEADALGLDVLAAVLLGIDVHLAALADDTDRLDGLVRRLRAAVAHLPVTYFAVGAAVLGAFGLAAAGRSAEAGQMLLAGAGGPDLPRLQLVDRAYGFELLVTAALADGDPAEARTWHARATALTDAGTPVDGMAAAAVHRAGARIAAADHDPLVSAELARRAADLAEGRAGALDATAAQLQVGSALARAGDPDQAATVLAAAAERARDLGVDTLRLLARRDLRRIGRRLTGATTTPLSRRERDVADLVAAGLSNGEIARVLGLSARTVQSHVAQVLACLGLPSRSAVPGVHAPAGVSAPTAPLTARQEQVAELVAHGYTNSGIASALGVSEKTVEKHLCDIGTRWGTTRRTAVAALWAAAAGAGR